MKASEKYKRGQYTTCNFQVFSDGMQVISTYDPKSTEKKHLTFKVRNLNKENEEILEDEEE